MTSQLPSNPSQKWQFYLAKVPMPVRMALATWLLFSLVFDLGLPSSTANLSPLLRFLVLLPTALLSLGLGIFVLWQGLRTLFRTVLSALQKGDALDNRSRAAFTFMGGVGALNIYMIAYYCITFGLAKLTGSYTISVIISGLITALMILVLFWRKPHPKDVKIFLWGGAAITLAFGFLMATVAAPLDQ